MRKSMLGTIGEAYERQALHNITQLKDNYINCIQMRNNTYLEIELNKETKPYFYDTCGLATHVNTEACIENALKEFIERQSFILSYLSKKPKKNIVKNKYFCSIVPKEFHFLDFFEVSFIESYKVVFCIGQRNDTSIDIALGAGYSIREALSNALKEVIPFSNDHGKTKVSNEENPDYIHIYNMLSIDAIINAYSYLKEGENYYPQDHQVHKRASVLEDLCHTLNMNPLMCTIPAKKGEYHRNKHSKNIKIFDFNWFPSLKVSNYDNSTYDRVEKITGLVLDRKVNFIPFP